MWIRKWGQSLKYQAVYVIFVCYSVCVCVNLDFLHSPWHLGLKPVFKKHVKLSKNMGGGILYDRGLV